MTKVDQPAPIVRTIQARNVFLVENAFTQDECQTFMEKSLEKGYSSIPPTGGKQLSWSGIDATEVRRNERTALQDEKIRELIWKRLKPFLPSDLSFRATDLGLTGDYLDSKLKGKEWKISGICDNLRFVRYNKKDQFLRHFDGTYTRNVVSQEGPSFKEQSFLSIIIYLNDDFEGGQTIFYDNNSKEEMFSVEPKTGTALLMLHENLHEGAQVTKGCKYILRTDVLYRKETKFSDPCDALKMTNTKLNKIWKQKDQKEVVSDWTKIYHPSCKLYTD